MRGTLKKLFRERCEITYNYGGIDYPYQECLILSLLKLFQADVN